MGTGEAIGLVRERGLAMAEAARMHPGAMAAILGLEDEAVENLCRKIIGVWPANYNCPGQIVISGEHDAVEVLCAEAEGLGARRAIRLKVSGAFHSPLVARAADRLKPAVDLIRFHERSGRLYELVDGTLVEKAMGSPEAYLETELIWLFREFLSQNDLGFLYGPDVLVPDTFFLNFEFPIRMLRAGERSATETIECVPRRSGVSSGSNRVGAAACRVAPSSVTKLGHRPFRQL